MRMLAGALVLLLLVLAPWSHGAGSSVPNDASQSLKAFVAEFYAWYVPIASDLKVDRPPEFALDKKPQLFSLELFGALKRDFRAQARSDEIVGIDWDPFLNSQDPGNYPGDPYETGKVTLDGGLYRVELFGVRHGVKHRNPDVVAELRREQGRWVFVNFRSPEGWDLLGMLRRLADLRSK